MATQDVFFWRLAGRSAPTGLAIVHWIGCINAIKVAITHLAIKTDSQLTHHIVAMKKVAEQHIFTKCCKCNTFEVISDLVHDFMNFNALKIIKKIY